MVITIKQTKSNFENLFEIADERNNNVMYYAKAPWLAVSTPFNMENIRKIQMTDTNGNEVFTTRYRVFDNAVEQLIPFKYLISGSQKFCRYEVIQGENEIGAFYVLQTGFVKKQFCIHFGDKVLSGYRIDKGPFNFVSVYDGDVQVAQITKPLLTENNLDIYYLHIVDEYQALLPLMSCFVIYYDYSKYNNSGQLTAKTKKVNYSYTYDKNNKFYNPAWIETAFDKEESERYNAMLEHYRAESGRFARRVLKIVGISLGAALVVAAIIVFSILGANGII